MYDIYQGISLYKYTRRYAFIERKKYMYTHNVFFCACTCIFEFEDLPIQTSQNKHMWSGFFFWVWSFFFELIFFFEFAVLPMQTLQNKHMLIGYCPLHTYMYIHPLSIFFLVCSREANCAWMSPRVIVEPLQTRTMIFLFNCFWTHKHFSYLCVGQPAVSLAIVSASYCDFRAVENT